MLRKEKLKTLKEEKFEYEAPQLLPSKPLHQIAQGDSCGESQTVIDPINPEEPGDF